jgi:UDP-GlcNAc:undecaprenyl-phosphate GlcNAc-1-phosphate transferase
VWAVLRLSHKKSWYDRIDERKIHTGTVPRLGGVGFSLAFIITALALAVNSTESYFGLRFIPVLIGMFCMVVCGVLDDFHALAPRQKLIVQIFAGILVIIPDYTFHHLFIFKDNFGGFVWLRFPLSFLWIVGLTNAVNFIDGVDGLAGGVSALITLSYAVIFASLADTGLVTLLCLCLAAAIGGFLFFNLPFPMAKIFMGDGGAYFLGFTLAVLPILTRLDFPILYSAALVIIPVLDMVSAIWRRIRDGRRIDSPDKLHIHHKLINLGLNAWSIDGLLYGLQIVVSLLVYFAIKSRGNPVLSLILLGLAYLIAACFFIIIHYLNRSKLLRSRNQTGKSVREAVS